MLRSVREGGEMGNSINGEIVMQGFIFPTIVAI